MELPGSSEMSLMVQEGDGRSGSVMGPRRTSVPRHSRTMISGSPAVWL